MKQIVWTLRLPIVNGTIPVKHIFMNHMSFDVPEL